MLSQQFHAVVIFSQQIGAALTRCPQSLQDMRASCHSKGPTLMVKAALFVLAATAPITVLAAAPATRLACYDRAVDVLARATASQEVVVIDRTEVRAARKGLFGFALPRIGFLSSRPGDAQDHSDESRLATTIVSAREIGYGKFRFTVDGGAVWETVEANSGFNDPHPGGKVLIEKGSLGSYFVQVDGRGRRVQAKRVG